MPKAHTLDAATGRQKPTLGVKCTSRSRVQRTRIVPIQKSWCRSIARTTSIGLEYFALGHARAGRRALFAQIMPPRRTYTLMQATHKPVRVADRLGSQPNPVTHRA